MKGGVTLVLALLLAGCFGADEEPVTSATTTSPTTEGPRDQPPDGREGRIAAFNETNRTENGTAGLDHTHDYWAGRERVTLMEGRVGMRAATMTRVSTARLTMPAEALVYEGTGQVEVTLSAPERRACTNVYDAKGWVCSDRAAGAPDVTGGPVNVHLLVRDAASTEWVDAGVVAWGKPIVIPITDPKQTDMPHATSTLWGFVARAEDATLDTLTFHAKVDAVRSTLPDIPEWPGHPDFYADSPTRVVLQTSAKTKESGPLLLVDPASSQLSLIPPEKLISYGTRTLHVFVNITEFKSDNPALHPTSWVLAWSNSSERLRGTSDENHTGAVKEHLFVLPVNDDGMDSPYASASRWRFGLYGEFELGAKTPNGYVGVLGCTGLCSVYEVSYDITILASSVALPPEAYAVRPG